MNLDKKYFFQEIQLEIFPLPNSIENLESYRVKKEKKKKRELKHRKLNTKAMGGGDREREGIL